MQFRECAYRARDTTLDVFANDDSASVQVCSSELPYPSRLFSLVPIHHPQATLFKTAQSFIAASPTVKSITYSLPNKHYIPVDLTYIGLENIRPPEKAEVFCPIAAPRCVSLGLRIRLSATGRLMLWFFSSLCYSGLISATVTRSA